MLDTLVYLKHETDCWFEITNLIIPGENDTDQELDAMTRWIVQELGPGVPTHFTAFHPDWKMLDKPATPSSTLQMARGMAQEAGLRYGFTGNTGEEVGQSTYCQGCGERVIGRDWYDITAWALSEDCGCQSSGPRPPGVTPDPAEPKQPRERGGGGWHGRGRHDRVPRGVRVRGELPGDGAGRRAARLPRRRRAGRRGARTGAAAGAGNAR